MCHLAALRASANREPRIVNPCRLFEVEVLEDLIDLLRDQCGTRRGIEAERNGAAKCPAELDEIGRLALHCEQARVERRVVTRT